jgi:diguanylate cyclase (GGDEF)-like protein/PAS domain S-box-containing protein
MSTERLRRLYAALSATNELIFRAEGVPELFEGVCRVAVEHGGFRLAQIRVIDGQGWLKPAAWHGACPEYVHKVHISVDARIPEGRGMAGRAARTGEYTVSNDYLAEAAYALWHRDTADAGIAAIACFPLRRGGAVFGLLNLYAGKKNAFDGQMEHLLERMAQNLSFALDNLDRRAALRESMLVLENTFEYMDQGISIVDKDLRVLGTNRRFRELLAFPESLCRPNTPFEAFIRYNAERGEYGPDDVEEQVRARLELARRFEAHRFERERPDGTVLEVRGLPVPGGGFVTVYTDVTARARSERELQRFRAALNLSSDGVYLVDCNALIIVDCNDGACRALGYTREELVGGSVDRIFADRTSEELRAEYARLVEGDLRHVHFEAYHRRKDGTVFPVEISRRIHDTPRGPILVGVARDVSERRRAEQRLALHARRQELIAELGRAVLAEQTLPGVLQLAATTARGVDADAAAVFEHQAAGRWILRAASGIESEAVLGSSFEVCPGCAVRAATHSSDPVVVADHLAERCQRVHGTWAVGMQSSINLQIAAARGTFGVLAVFSKKPSAFSEDDVKFARAVCDLLSIAVRRLHAEQQLAYLAQFDELTGLPNRSLLRDRLQHAIVHARRSEAQVAVLFVDLDRFKLVNDSLGHHRGDLLLAEVGKRIASCVRKGDSVGRISGDEFAVVLPDLARPDDAAPVARKILEALRARYDLDGNEVYVSASIGIAAFPHDGDDADALLKEADEAMYLAKHSGRDRWCFYTPQLNQRSLEKMNLANDLRRAAERREFVLYYQPKVDLASGALTGFEALIRWQHPERGIVAPAQFIPALEESGLIGHVGEWVIGEAGAQLNRWRASGLRLVPISVNLSARQLLGDDPAGVIQRIVHSTGVAPELIELEITESCLMDQPDKAVKVLRSLTAAGLKISLDDFGTGYSSLAYLTRLPLAAIKIDRSFVRELPHAGSATAIVRAIVEMARTLGFTVVAEGVETEEQAAALRGHGCHQGQGYLFGRPAPVDEIARLLSAAEPKA